MMLAPATGRLYGLGVGPGDPELVTLWTGPNDVIAGRSTDDFESRLDDVLQRVDAPGRTLAVANIPDLTALPHFQADPDRDVTRARIDAFNQAKIIASNHFNLLSVTTVAVLFVLITIPQGRLVDKLIERDQKRMRSGS